MKGFDSSVTTLKRQAALLWPRPVPSVVMALIIMPLALADAGKANSAAYQEVTLDLDPGTKALGGAVYAEHCAACHDGNTVRAPQRYVLENVSPETILTAMIDGPMRAVASELSLEQKTAVAEFIAERKITPGEAANAGVACEGRARPV